MLRKETDGPLAGYTVIDLDFGLFAAFEVGCAGQPYVWDGKCLNLGSFPPRWGIGGDPSQPCDGPDCSGYVRAILDYASGGATSGLPDGSWMEDQWLATTGFKPTAYANCGDGDEHVRLCVHRPGGRGWDSTGHIWLVVHGHTVESCGGHGPWNQTWENAWMLDHVDDCFVLC